MLPSDFPIFPVTALIVEDEPLIAVELGDVLTSRGVKEVGYATMAEATEAVARRRWGVVLLDIGLGTGESMLALAASLRKGKVPFIFCSGSSERPAGFERVPLVRKPYRPSDIIAALLMAGVSQIETQGAGPASVDGVTVRTQ
ncbi:MAG: response regulator [Microvirga sp.]